MARRDPFPKGSLACRKENLAERKSWKLFKLEQELCREAFDCPGRIFLYALTPRSDIPEEASAKLEDVVSKSSGIDQSTPWTPPME